MGRHPTNGVREELTCLECGQPFNIWRTAKNRNAKIRYCDECRRRHDADAPPRGLGDVPRKKGIGRQ